MSERIGRLRIELHELKARIRRRIDIPLSATPEALHDAIQMTTGWIFSHLWEFDLDGRCYSDPSFREFDDEPVIYKAKGLRLGTAIARGADRFVYTYDYGDNWRHDVIVEEVRDGDPDMEYPALVDGARRCPPEDVGGVDGFMDFLEAVLDPVHEEHRDMVRWYGGPLDPFGFDEKRARFGMGTWRGGVWVCSPNTELDRGGRDDDLEGLTVHSAVDLRLLAWWAAEKDNGQDRMVQRKDRYGHPIRWEDYENEGSQFGWFIEPVDPKEREFPPSLRPVSYRSRQPGGTNYTDTDGA